MSMSAPIICDTCFPGLSAAALSQIARDQAPDAVPEDVTNPETFTPPLWSAASPSVIIEFCDKCRWLHRSTWVQTELLLTFPPPLLQSVALIPHNTPETNGRFRIWLQYAAAEGALSTILIWDRKTRGGFPDLKEVKQLIRDRIQPGLSLGHSDRKKEEDAT